MRVGKQILPPTSGYKGVGKRGDRVALHIKICGFTTEEGIEAAVAAGVNAIGLVLDPSPRQLTLERALALKALIPRGVDVVAVCGRPTSDEIREICEVLQPDTIQLMADALPNVPVDVPVLPSFEDGPDLTQRVAHYAASLGRDRPLVLADGPKPGSGIRADWNRVSEISETTRLIIAGGLNPENVGDAIALLRPYGVDVSSGVERAVGCKDPQRIIDFVNSVRAAERFMAAP